MEDEKISPFRLHEIAKGDKDVYIRLMTLHGHIIVKHKCTACAGTGHIKHSNNPSLIGSIKCPHCAGTGKDDNKQFCVASDIPANKEVDDIANDLFNRWGNCIITESTINNILEYLYMRGYKRTNQLVALKHKDLKEFLDKVELETEKRESFTLRNAISGQTSLLADIICSNGKFSLPAPKSVEEIEKVIEKEMSYCPDTLEIAQAVHRLVYGEKK